MSSVDLHTHSGFQRMLPESFAVVCAPKSTPKYVLVLDTYSQSSQHFLTVLASSDSRTRLASKLSSNAMRKRRSTPILICRFTQYVHNYIIPYLDPFLKRTRFVCRTPTKDMCKCATFHLRLSIFAKHACARVMILTIYTALVDVLSWSPSISLIMYSRLAIYPYLQLAHWPLPRYH